MIAEIGIAYRAIGTCGITDGLLVEGKFKEYKFGGALLEDDKGQLYLVNKNTLEKV